MSEKDHRAEIMMILSRHVGKEKAIGMGELYTRVYNRPWRHRINDTKPLRDEIKEMRYAGALIGETRSSTGGGYYLARSVTELNEWMERRLREALRKIKMVAAMKRIGLPELLGQMQMNLQGRTDGEDARGNEKPGEQPTCADQDSSGTPGGVEFRSGKEAPGDTLHLF